MQKISVLHPPDVTIFDEDTLNELSRDLGPEVAENILCRALEDIAARLVQIREQYVAGDYPGLRKSVRAVMPIATQVGLPSLSRVGQDVLNSIDKVDPVALAATLCRFLRSGETAISCAEMGMDLSL